MTTDETRPNQIDEWNRITTQPSDDPAESQHASSREPSSLQEVPKGARTTPEESRMMGHWLLAKIGKTVLRPGGIEMTNALLDHAHVREAESIVEFGPGVGRTATLLLAAGPRHYTAVDPNPEGSRKLREVLDRYPQVDSRVVIASAENTGLPANSADLVVGEALLTMMKAEDKQAVEIGRAHV